MRMAWFIILVFHAAAALFMYWQEGARSELTIYNLVIVYIAFATLSIMREIEGRR